MEYKIETKEIRPTHMCDWCGHRFVCEESWLGDNGVRWCSCVQYIVRDLRSSEVARLAFWCSDECHDEDYPEEDDEVSEDDELPDLEGDGEETEEEPMPPLVPDDGKA